MKRIRRLGAMLVLAGLLAACGSSAAGGGGGGGGGSGIGGVVTISNESGSLWTCDFNPFNPSVLFLSFGPVYEPLAFVNTLQNEKTTPWLATSYIWSNSNKTLTWTIRKGVKWSDNTPLTAADVVYTFSLLHKYPALDLQAVWSVLSSVTLKGSDQVVMNFKTSAVPYFYYIADQTPIVPKHIWSKIKNPVTFGDQTPVGSGPFTMNRCTGQNIEFVRNPNYWQPGLPKIDKVEYPAFTSNDTANSYLSEGLAQWGSQFIPSVNRVYTSKNPKNFHYWYPPTSNVSIFMNLTEAPLNDPVLRRAMAYAINRSRVSQIGESGYQPPSNQTGIVLPTFRSWYDSSAAASYDYTYNPQKAISLLESAGYKRGSDGIFQSPSGTPLSFSMLNIGDYSDWVASAAVVQSDLAAVGIKVTTENLSSTDYDNDLYNGKYQLAYGAENGGPSPYYELRQLLYGPNSAPIGQTASTNWERYISPATDKLLDEFGATTDVATQHAIMDQLQEVMLKDVPVIPMTEQVDWYQYDTQSIGGWVTPSDPYAQPSAFNNPDIEVMLLHLYSK